MPEPKKKKRDWVALLILLLLSLFAYTHYSGRFNRGKDTVVLVPPAQDTLHDAVAQGPGFGHQPINSSLSLTPAGDDNLKDAVAAGPAYDGNNGGNNNGHHGNGQDPNDPPPPPPRGDGFNPGQNNNPSPASQNSVLSPSGPQ